MIKDEDMGIEEKRKIKKNKSMKSGKNDKYLHEIRLSQEYLTTPECLNVFVSFARLFS